MRDRVLGLIKRFGWNATAFQVLDGHFAYWFHGDDACVAYVDTGAAWVVAGAPLCAPEALGEVARSFCEVARAAGRRAVFFGVEPRFLEATGFPALGIGEQPVWAPADWASTVARSKGLKEQLRRARAKGVQIREVARGGPSPDERAALEALRRRWQDAHAMAPMGFLVAPADLSALHERRLWLAERGGQLVAWLLAAPIAARSGFLFQELVRDPAAPNGTAELLVGTALEALSAEGHQYATLGLAPLSGTVKPWLGAVAKLSAPLYDFEGLRRFKARLRPSRWDPLSLAVPPEGHRAIALWDSLVAFARGGMLRFGLETLFRVPQVVVELLGLALIPWTLGLAFLDGPRWFPWPWVQWAWVAFDAVLAMTLLALARTWRSRLGLATAVAVTLDTVVTLAQVLGFNAAREPAAPQRVLLAVACTAPALGAVLLWRALVRRSRAR